MIGNKPTYEEYEEYWSCFEYVGDNFLFSLRVYKESKEAYVVMDGERIAALRTQKGLDRHWYMEPDFKVAIIVRPDGTAGQYDFSQESRTKPSTLFECYRRK